MDTTFQGRSGDRPDVGRMQVMHLYNDPHRLGVAILQYKRVHNCTILQAADAVFSDPLSALTGSLPRATNGQETGAEGHSDAAA